MDITVTEVRKAQATIREAERKLERIVKQYLETVETIKNIFNYGEDFITDFEDCGLHITVSFFHDKASDYYSYLISCQEYEISCHEPLANNNSTAQGMLKVEWDTVVKDGKLEPVVKTISLKKYLQ